MLSALQVGHHSSDQDTEAAWLQTQIDMYKLKASQEEQATQQIQQELDNIKQQVRRAQLFAKAARIAGGQHQLTCACCRVQPTHAAAAARPTQQAATACYKQASSRRCQQAAGGAAGALESPEAEVGVHCGQVCRWW